MMLVLLSYSSLACMNTQERVFKYGESVSLNGKVELRKYMMPLGDQLEAYVLVLTDSIKTQQSENYSYGEERMMLELHLDSSNPELKKYQNKVVSIRARIRPSENTHHLGHACLYQLEIMDPETSE